MRKRTTRQNNDPETEPLILLGDLQNELAASLKSLAGKKPQRIGDRYHVTAGGYINRSAEGYLLLRTNGRIDASKLLIRPAIEAVFRIQALRTKPDLLYHIAWTERLEDNKWFRSVAQRQGVEYDESRNDQAWKRFEHAYRLEFPEAPLVPKKLTAFDAAEAAGLADYYGSHYRMYSQYTHAALQATGGHLDVLSDTEDTRTMIFCAYCALAAIAVVGASAPNLETLRQRVDDLSKHEPAEMRRQVVD